MQIALHEYVCMYSTIAAHSKHWYKGVKQGVVMSPLPFTCYTDKLFHRCSGLACQRDAAHVGAFG